MINVWRIICQGSCQWFPLIEYTTDVPLYGSAPELRVGKLVTVAPKTTIATRVLAAFTTALDAPICRFEAHAKYIHILDTGNKAGAARDSVVQHYDGKVRGSRSAYGHV